MWSFNLRKSTPKIVKEELVEYPTPLTLNYLWGFGSLSGICLFFQILTGIFLAMHYTPHAEYAFFSVERIMRDINFGWFLRYFHSNGASFFFLAIYIHMSRSLFHFSFASPKQYLWISGIIIYILMVGTAFLGYVLPWGQMSFWAATVITNIITSLPLHDGGESFAIWLWGGFSVDNPTLNRFFSLHYALPFFIVALIFVHLFFLHKIGSSDPCLYAKDADLIRFYPYFFLKDLFGFFIFFFCLCFFIFFAPNILGHPDNYIEANPLITPKHIVPEWYFLPFYGILRSIHNKFLGIVTMSLALLFLLILPFFVIVNDKNLGYSYGLLTFRFRRIYRIVSVLFMGNFAILGWVGGQSVSENFLLLGSIGTFFYFLFFFIVFYLFRQDRNFFFLI